jgi:20S proteasome subunit alpha 6
MRQQAMSSKMIFNRPVPVNRLVSAIAESLSYLPCHTYYVTDALIQTEAQVNTQEYGRRPYGVGFLVIGQDESGPHLFEFSPSGNSYEYYAMSIGARSQSAKTYLEKHYESFPDCMCINMFDSADCQLNLHLGSLEDLIRHGLHALRETLQQDKELNINNTSIGIVGPASQHEKAVPPSGPFRILEGVVVEPFLETMIAKQTDTAAPVPPAVTADEDVQMDE